METLKSIKESGVSKYEKRRERGDSGCVDHGVDTVFGVEM